eukprot:scaffold17971_cov20-Tisochrysis_lutea.AAC.2
MELSTGICEGTGTGRRGSPALSVALPHSKLPLISTVFLQESARALAQAKEATHRAYPEAADAVQEAATSVSLTMRTKLVQAEKAFMASRAAEEKANEAARGHESCGAGPLNALFASFSTGAFASSAAEEKAKEAAREAKVAEQSLNSALDEIEVAREGVSRAVRVRAKGGGREGVYCNSSIRLRPGQSWSNRHASAGLVCWVMPIMAETISLGDLIHQPACARPIAGSPAGSTRSGREDQERQGKCSDECRLNS